MSKENLNDAFVIDYVLEKEKFIFILSSIALLNNAKTSNQYEKGYVCVDSTYKLMTCKFPLLIISTRSKDRHLRQIAFAILSNEDKESFAFVFKSLMKFINTELNFEWEIYKTMNDFDEAFNSAWRNLFPHVIQLNCKIHLERNVKKQKIDKKIKKIILEDILYLSESISTEEFQTRWQLTRKFWEDQNDSSVNNFLKYFEGQYIKKNQNWYLGICPVGLRNTNNALEGFNCAFKRTFVSYERQDIALFLNTMKSIIYYISSNQNVINQEEEICSSKEVWTKAQVLAEEHTYSLGNALFAFPNFIFFEQNFLEITKDMLQFHLYANKYAKSLEDYKKKKMLKGV